MLTGIIRDMARCTAPTRGHHTASGRAACPACGGRSGGYGYGSSYPSYTPSYAPSYSSSVSIDGSARPRWSRAGSFVAYTTNEVRALTPIRETIEKQVPLPEGRDYFLCHAWDDRAGVAKELYELLQSRGVSVWFSESDISLGTPFLREIDKGLAKSKAGIVLVTPALLLRLKGESIADKELSVLLAREQLIPIVHGTTYDALREISPMLASRNGLNTADNLMADVAAKLAELVAI
jgi:TIR domain